MHKDIMVHCEDQEHQPCCLLVVSEMTDFVCVCVFQGEALCGHEGCEKCGTLHRDSSG